jgi:hypothetical protein
MSSIEIQVDVVTDDPEVLKNLVDAVLEHGSGLNGPSQDHGDQPLVFVDDRNEVHAVILSLVEKGDAFEVFFADASWNDRKPTAFVAALKELGLSFVAREVDDRDRVTERRWLAGMETESRTLYADGEHSMPMEDLVAAYDKGSEDLVKIVAGWNRTKYFGTTIVVPPGVLDALKDGTTPRI